LLLGGMGLHVAQFCAIVTILLGTLRFQLGGATGPSRPVRVGRQESSQNVADCG